MSSINGPISRSEVVSRAQNWVDRQVPYSQSAYTTDPEGDKTYRQDCSGYVSMCWHLDTSLTTSTLPGRATAIGFADVKAGDAVAYSGHVALAAGPVSGSNITIYQERSPGYVAQKVTNPISLYSNAYRYNNITDTDNTPIGHLDTFEVEGDSIRIVGWALSTATTAPVTVQMVIDGSPVAIVAATLDREDLVGPYNVGPNHGFDLTVPTFGGPQSVTVNAINGNVQPAPQASLGTSSFSIGTPDQIRSFLDAIGVDLLYRASNPGSVTDAEIADFQNRGTLSFLQQYVYSQEHGYGFIRRAYQAFLNRAAKQSDLDVQWGGMVSGMNERDIVSNIAASDECWNRFGATAEGWVAGLYETFLGREGSTDEINNQVAHMTGNRADTVFGFIESREFSDRLINTLFQQMLLREADQGALDSNAPIISAGTYRVELENIAYTPEYWLAVRRR